jgi:hypothetical protein
MLMNPVSCIAQVDVQERQHSQPAVESKVSETQRPPSGRSLPWSEI